MGFFENVNIPHIGDTKMIDGEEYILNSSGEWIKTWCYGGFTFIGNYSTLPDLKDVPRGLLIYNDEDRCMYVSTENE